MISIHRADGTGARGEVERADYPMALLAASNRAAPVPSARLRRPQMEVKTMDRARIADRLAQAERHVSQGESHIRRQREIVGELAHFGHDTAVARDLLLILEKTQATLVATRDRLRRDFALP